MPLAFCLFTILHRMLRAHMITCQAGGAILSPNRFSINKLNIIQWTFLNTLIATNTCIIYFKSICFNKEMIKKEN